MAAETLATVTGFDDIADVLLSIGSLISPAELQGQLVGQLALGAAPTRFEWLRQLQDLTGARLEAGSRNAEVLADWVDEVQAQLSDVDFVFQPLLPDEDSTALPERMEAFANWCQAFMSGVAIVSARPGAGADLNADNRELLGDIMAVSCMDLDAEASEADFNDVVEYLRVAVIQMCLETLAGSNPAAD